MNKQNVSKFIKGIGTALSAHSPEILTGIGVAGMITTTILAVKATPKALQLIDDAKEKKKDKLTPAETVKAAWKPYIPAAITGVASAACVIGASSVNFKRNAALTAACQLSTTALSEYKEKVAEVVGEKKETEIREKIAQDRVTKNPPTQKNVIFTGDGDTLFLDSLSGRYFKSNRNKIEKAINDLNFRMTAGTEMCISLNEFYIAIGLPQLMPLGEELGWRADEGLIDIEYDAALTDDQNNACVVIGHRIPPKSSFHSFY